MLVGYLPDPVVWWLFQQSCTCWSSVWFLTSQMNLLFSVWIHSVENQKLLKSMVLCPGFVIKSPSPAVPPDSPAHTVSTVNIFWSAPFFIVFFWNTKCWCALFSVACCAMGKKWMLKVCQSLLCMSFCDKGKEEGVKSFCIAMGNTLSM